MKEKFLNSSITVISKNQKYTKDEIDIIKYGLETLYLTITKMIIIFSLAYILNIFKETFILLITYNIIRSQAFGLHATRSIYCLITSIIFFIGGAYLCKYTILPNFFIILTSIICNILLLIYAPADTHKRPLINKKRRKKFKIISTIFGITYTILIIIFTFTQNRYLINFLFFGMIEAVLMILPLSYKIFKLPYNNYKKYNV